MGAITPMMDLNAPTCKNTCGCDGSPCGTACSVPDPQGRRARHRVQPTATIHMSGNFEALPFRVGDWRVLYVVETREKLLRVAAILSRGEAYR